MRNEKWQQIKVKGVELKLAFTAIDSIDAKVILFGTSGFQHDLNKTYALEVKGDTLEVISTHDPIRYDNFKFPSTYRIYNRKLYFADDHTSFKEFSLENGSQELEFKRIY